MAFAALTIDIKAQMAQFDAAIKGVSRQVSGLERSLSSVGNSFRSLLPAASLAGFAYLAKSTFDAAGELKDLADLTGITTDQLQELAYAGATVGISVEDMQTSFVKFARSISEAAGGNVKLRDAFKEVGVSIADLRDLKPSEIFEKSADGLSEISDQAKKAELDITLFGKGGSRMGLLFSASLRQLRDDAHRVGAVLSQDVIEQADSAGDRLDVMGRVIKTQLIVAMVNLAPTIEAVGNAFANAAPSIAEFFQNLLDTSTVTSMDVLQRRADTILRDIQDVNDKLTESKARKGSNALKDKAEDFFFGVDEQELKKKGDELTQQLRAVYDRVDELQLEFSERQLKKPGGANRQIVDPEAASKLKEFQTELESLLKETDSGRIQQFVDDMEILNKALELGPEKGGITVEQWDEAVKKLGEDFVETTGKIDGTTKAAEKFAQTIEQAVGKTAAGQIAELDANLEAVHKALLEHTNGVTQEMYAQYKAYVEKQKEEIKQGDDEMSKFADQAARNIQDAFADFLFDPFDGGLKGMVAGFANAIRRMVAEAASAEILKAVFGSNSSGGADIAGFIQAGMTLFGFAMGGSVQGGKPILVGENGPEIFTPQSSGYITPNNAISGIGGAVYAPVYNIDARGADQGVEMKIRAGMEQAARKGYQMAIDDARRNGPLRKSLR